MLKNIKNRLSKRKELELKNTLGEDVRDAIIKAGLKAMEEYEYGADNPTEKFVGIVSSIGNAVDS